jgi:hypothetical protein
MRVFAMAAWLGAFWLPTLTQAQESVCLKSGFCMEAESHMISDGMLVIQSGKGTLGFPVEQVEAITALPLRPKPPIAAQVTKTSNAVTNARELLIQAALQQGLEPEFVRSVALIESGIDQRVISEKGAIGVMQLMPGTAGQLGVNPWSVDQNVLGGATYLRQLLLRYNGDSALALAAYNAGPGAVDKYKGVPPYAETRRYVVKVLNEYARQQRIESEKNLQAEKAMQIVPAQSSEAAQALRAQTAKPNGSSTVVTQ